MGLEQIPGAIKIGSTTAASDGNNSIIYLPGGIQTSATFLGTYYPDFTPTQRVGIIPDYYVYPTIKGIREGRDEVLEFALNCDFVGVQEVDNKEEISIYPNPTRGELRITNYELRIDGVEVFDVFGRKQCFGFAQQPSHESRVTSHEIIDVSSLSAGIYFVKIQTNNGVIIKKVVKY
jgi:hypothetical protein